MKIWPAAHATAACCGCAPSRKLARRILSLTVKAFLPGAELRDNGAHTARTFRAGLPRQRGGWIMKSFHKSWVRAAILVAALASALAPKAAAQGSISGTIMDVNGKPWAEVTIRSVSD